jgi:hypothetical protein
LDLDRIFPFGANDRLGHAHAVETVTHDRNRFGELILLLKLTEAFCGRLVNYQSDSDPTLEVEAQAKLALSGLQDVLEQNIVPLILVCDIRDVNLREKLSVVDLFLGSEISKRDEERWGFVSLDTRFRACQQVSELSLFGSHLRDNKFLKGAILKRRDAHHTPENDGAGEQEFPKYITGHNVNLTVV